MSWIAIANSPAQTKRELSTGQITAETVCRQNRQHTADAHKLDTLRSVPCYVRRRPLAVVRSAEDMSCASVGGAIETENLEGAEIPHTLPLLASSRLCLGPEAPLRQQRWFRDFVSRCCRDAPECRFADVTDGDASATWRVRRSSIAKLRAATSLVCNTCNADSNDQADSTVCRQCADHEDHLLDQHWHDAGRSVA